MELSDANVSCPYLLLSLYAVALNEPTTVSEICECIEQSVAWSGPVDDEKIETAVDVLADGDLVQIEVDPYRAYVISLGPSSGSSDVRV